MHLWYLFICVHMTAFRWGESIKKGMGREKACLYGWECTDVSAQLHLKPQVRTRKQPLANVAGPASSSREGCVWMGSRPRTEPVHATGAELGSESRTGKRSWTDVVSTQALFKLIEDYTPNASPMSGWVILCCSKTLGREMLNSKFTHPKDTEPDPGKVILVPDGCQTSVRAAFLQLLKWMKDFTGASGSFL